MSLERKRFIVVSLGDTKSWGYDEQTLPMLLEIIDSSSPDFRVWTHVGVLANYLTSPRALKVVEDVIAKAERLRDADPRFTTLGIGLAEGELSADFDWLGRLKTDRKSMRPLGEPLNEAVRCEREPEEYKETLRTLRERVHSMV